MARFWRKPGVLMTAYLALYVSAAAWATTRASVSHPLVLDPGSPIIALFLALRVTAGGYLSRVLIIVYTIGLIQHLLWGADIKSGGLISVGLLAILLAQIALLVSTPIYECTRKYRADRPPSTAPLWPVPRWWLAAVALAAGLLITLASLGSENSRAVSCTPNSGAAAQCAVLAQGFPVHYLSAVPDGDFSYPVIYKGAAAEDMAIWTVLSFAACYLIWLPSRRPAEAATAPMAAPV